MPLRVASKGSRETIRVGKDLVMNYRQHKTFPYLEGKIQKRGAFVSISHPLTCKKGAINIYNVTSPFLGIRL